MFCTSEMSTILIISIIWIKLDDGWYYVHVSNWSHNCIQLYGEMNEQKQLGWKWYFKMELPIMVNLCIHEFDATNQPY